MRGVVLESAAAGPPREIRVAEFQQLFDDTGASGGLARAVHLHRPVARDGPALGDHAEADDLRPDRRAGRGADRGAARAGRRRAQLGLPLHLGPRRLVLGVRAARHGLHRGGGAVRPLAAGPGRRARTARRRRPAQHHVPGRRVVRPARGEPRPLEGYRGSLPVRIGNGAADQLQLDIYGEAMDCIYLADAHGLQVGHAGWTALRHAARLARRQLGPARRRHLGDPRRPAGLHLRPADVLGGVRPGDPAGHRPGAAGRARRWTAARDAHLRADHGPRLEPESRPSSSTTTPTCSTPRCCGCRRVGFIYARRPDVAVDPARDGRASWSPTASSTATTRAPHRTAAGSEGTFSLCTFMVRRRPGPRRPPRRGPAHLREDAHLRQPRRPLLRGDRPDRRAARQLPAGVHPPRADRRRDDPRRGPRPRGVPVPPRSGPVPTPRPPEPRVSPEADGAPAPALAGSAPGAGRRTNGRPDGTPA